MRLLNLGPECAKMIIRDTIETYSGQWRIIHEAVQNAHDAIQQCEHREEGTIKIRLCLGTNKTEVWESGTGINIDAFPHVFTLGGTDKGDSELRKVLKGSQGVGIKATVFTSAFFEIDTKSALHKWQIRVRDCYRYLEPSFDDEIHTPVPETSQGADTWTKVSYSLHDYSVEDLLQEIADEYCAEFGLVAIPDEEELKKAFERYFRSQTYLGCVQSLLGLENQLKPMSVQLAIAVDYPSLSDLQDCRVTRCPFLRNSRYHGRVISCTFPARYLDLEDAHANLPQAQHVDLLYHHFSEVIETPPNPDAKKMLIQKVSRDQAEMLLWQIKKDRATGKFRFLPDPERLAKHARLLEKLNGLYLVVGPRGYLADFLRLAPQQLISVNGLPTNIALAAPKGAGELGYLLNIHLLLDLDTTLGYGKRNISSVVKGQADAYFADAFTVLRRVAKGIVGESESFEPPGGQWLKEEEYEAFVATGNPFRDAELPTKLPPQEEQDVVCLFHQLVGDGTLEGYHLFRASTDRPYDALMYISDEEDDRRFPDQFKDWPALKCVEFKLRTSQLIQDFAAGRKFLRDIDLLVVWEDDYDQDSEYIISALERDGVAPFPGAQKRLRLGRNACQVLVLKQLLFPEGNA